MSATLKLKIKGTKVYKEWKKKIKETNSYTCNRCGYSKHKNKITIHHKTKLSKLIKNYNIESVTDALKCRTLWQTELGECLCLNCHEKLHGLRKLAKKLTKKRKICTT